MRDCEIKGNAQTNTTGGVGGGLAYRNAWTNAIVERCTIEGNEGFDGGGVHIECEGSSDDGVDHGSAVLSHCQIVGNTAARDGGGISAVDNGNVKNCLVYDNVAGDDGGGAYIEEGAQLRNCTIADNAATDKGDGIRVNSPGAAYNTIIYFNGTENVSGSGTLANCCTVDPHFYNRPADDYTITGAPCKDVGNNTYVDWNQDLDGSNRIVNGTVDIGAYEVQP